jgi:transcription-repair coupling factor (superfamily II helicase)
VLALLRAAKPWRAFRDAVLGAADDAPEHVGGCHGSLLAFFLAALAAPDLPTPILLLVPEDKDADAAAADLALLGAPPVRVLFGRESEAPRRERAVAADSGSWLTIASVSAALAGYPAPEDVEAGRLRLSKGAAASIEDLVARIAAAGFDRMPVVSAPRQYALRGDLIDVFDGVEERPLRIEVFGDAVEGLRRFDPVAQVSVGEVPEAAVWLGPGKEAAARAVSLAEHLRKNTVVLAKDPLRIEHATRSGLEVLPDDDRDAAQARLSGLRRLREIVITRVRGPGGRALNLGSQVVTAEGTTFESAAKTLERVSRGKAVTVVGFDASLERESFFAALEAPEASAEARACLKRTFATLDGPLSEGFGSALLGVAAVSHHELFAVERAPSAAVEEAAPPPEARPLDTFLDLQEGDYVVHLVHGIGRFLRLDRIERGGAEQDFLVLEFKDGLHLHVPAAKIDLVQKYIGGRGDEPELSKVGGKAWSKRKEEAAQAAIDLAVELLELNAVRARAAGVPHPPDSPWQQAFEAAFPYQETPDQLTALGAIKKDLESRVPMDRLLCGDVGYGKTELAMRAAFKVVMGGRQAAMLVPTTILAQQHHETFRARMKDFPVTVGSLSRFRTEREQKEVIEGLAAGSVDIVIGTHRMLQDDVVFKDLGILIVDEEQRFGVGHKEKLRRLRKTLDVLSLSATPIPRTLHQSMLGIREISALRQAPPGRLPVKSEVVEFDAGIIRAGILREIGRGGQVFYVHNRVQTIHKVESMLRELVPEAKFVVGHGQMAERELERAMLAFVEGRAQVLLSTNIVESGLHIPAANTIFVDRAEACGLSDLHQLRGRVGRSREQAYAYFLLRADTVPTEIAEKRLHAIEEFNHLGAGFQLAMRDLEIRGAGNILGPEQSGHIANVGYDLYCRLLDLAVKKLKQEPILHPEEIELFLDFNAYLPEAYIPDLRLRIELYRKLGRCRAVEDFAAIVQELRDRFGPPPRAVEEFVDVARIRGLMERERIQRLEVLKGEGVLIGVKRMDRFEKRLRLPPSELRVIGGKKLLLVHPAAFPGPRALLEFLEASIGERPGYNPAAP